MIRDNPKNPICLRWAYKAFFFTYVTTHPWNLLQNLSFLSKQKIKFPIVAPDELGYAFSALSGWRLCDSMLLADPRRKRTWSFRLMCSLRHALQQQIHRHYGIAPPLRIEPWANVGQVLSPVCNPPQGTSKSVSRPEGGPACSFCSGSNAPGCGGADVTTETTCLKMLGATSP
jgi:hypothetical protein